MTQCADRNNLKSQEFEKKSEVLPMEPENNSSVCFDVNLPIDAKNNLRLLLKNKRAIISNIRRKEAAEKLTASLLLKVISYKTVLSFHSLPEEIDTSFLNSSLAKQGKLFLPRVTSESLLIYQVNDPLKELQQSNFRILEPNPHLCAHCELEKIDCILVPGLGFDNNHQRIGYGKGHYDRLLEQVKTLSLAPAIIGLGFKEQLIEKIPCELHDIKMDELILF